MASPRIDPTRGGRATRSSPISLEMSKTDLGGSTRLKRTIHASQPRGSRAPCPCPRAVLLAGRSCPPACPTSPPPRPAVCATPRATGRARALACLVRAFRRGEFCSRSPDRMCVGGRPSQVRSTAPPSSAIAGGTVGRRRRAAVVGGGASDGRRRLSMLLQTVHARKGSLALRAAP